MPQPQLIVCETTGRWAVLLRRCLADSGVAISETRSLDECRQRLFESPGSFAVLQSTAGNFEPLARLLLEIEPTESRAVVVADRELAACRWLLREAGALHVVLSPRRIGELVRMIRRHIQRRPDRHRTLRQYVWSQLPWNEYSTTRTDFA